MSYNEIVYPYIEGEPKNVIIDVKEIKAFLKLPLEPDEYLDMELVDMSATTVIKDILEAKGKSQIELAEEINVTRQNLSNKMSRDKFSSLELVEIADALEMNLILKDKADGTEYVIDYPEDEKGKSKRNMTEEEKRAAQKKSEATKARNAKKQAESQED